MTKTPTPASHAVNTAPISADLRGIKQAEAAPEALQIAATLEALDMDGCATVVRHMYARIVDLEAQLAAIGAGGVESLRKNGAARGQSGFEAWWRDKYPSFAMHAPDVWEAAMHHAAQPSRECLQQSAEPLGWLVHIPSSDTQNVYDSQDDASYVDDLTNNDDAVVTPLYAALQAAQPAPAAHGGWTDDQMNRFAWMCINPGLGADSISCKLAKFRELEAIRGNDYPPAQAVQDQEYGSTEYGFVHAGFVLQDGDKRLMSLLVRALGSDHAAINDLDSLFSRASRAAPPAPQGEKVYAELPEPATTGLGDEYESFDRDGRAMGKAYETIRYFTADQMRNFADAAADLRSIPAPALAAAAQQGTTP